TVWAGEYDRELSDLFAVQAEIAEQIVAAVHARLTREEKARIDRTPTSSLAAYDLYLRALDRRRPLVDLSSHLQAIALLEHAVSLDPGFALAYALMARLHEELFFWSFDPTTTRLALARKAAETALRQDPDRAEPHIAWAVILYHSLRNYPEAIRELEQARRIAPGDSLVYEWLAYVARRQCRWRDALAYFDKTLELDPRNEIPLSQYAECLNGLRRYADAEQAYARLASFARHSAMTLAERAYNLLAWRGLLQPLEAAEKEIPPDQDPRAVTSMLKYRLRLYRRDFVGASSVILSCVHDSVGLWGGEKIPKAFYAAEALRLAGEHDKAKPLYQGARRSLEESLHDRDEQPQNRVALAHVLAALGEKDAGHREADRALAILPDPGDSTHSVIMLALTAAFRASVGAQDRALDELARALALPYGLHARMVELDPYWDSLRDDPRYKELIATHLPKDPV
ncbi:MAG: tetratricopeptide repeat protein, partial [Burkholderiales bacterium]